MLNILFYYYYLAYNNSYLLMVYVTDLAQGARLGVALYSRIAIRVANSNIVPFWPVGRVVKAIHSACLRILVLCCHRILELSVFVLWDLA